MVKFENECMDCDAPGYPCIGKSCPNRNVAHFYCDSCKYEVEELHVFDDKEMCVECIIDRLPRVKVEV